MSGIKKADLQKIRLIRTCSFSQKIIFVKQQKRKCLWQLYIKYNKKLLIYVNLF
ncbi:hypothetical protein PMI10_03944 [Flavobacterium sp. CF136]|jgi:hypothetical protein|nr:hypothetical protein PMI10_03944 [Flavobacterium sp. CF136]